MLLATLALLFTSLHAVWALIANGMVVAIAVLVVVGLGGWSLLGGPEPDRPTVLALAGASAILPSRLPSRRRPPSEHFGAAALPVAW
jgi:hypothetical protein